MEDNRSEFEKSLDPSYQPSMEVGEKKVETVKAMEEKVEIDHHSRPLTVNFRTRYHALEAWSGMKKILETFQVDQQTAAAMMESMSALASAIDADIKNEISDKKEIQELRNKIEESQNSPSPVQLKMPLEESHHAG